MTTKVTIDAHAGWPVLVIGVQGERNAEKQIFSRIVEPNTQLDLYLHSGFRITGIEELPRND